MRRGKREGLSRLKHVTHTHQRDEIIQPTADFRSGYRDKQVFRKRRYVVPEIHANRDVTGYADFHAAANADERLHLRGPGQKREIAERLVQIFVPRAAEQADAATCRGEGPDAGTLAEGVIKQVIVDEVGIPVHVRLLTRAFQHQVVIARCVPDFASEVLVEILSDDYARREAVVEPGANTAGRIADGGVAHE